LVELLFIFAHFHIFININNQFFYISSRQQNAPYFFPLKSVSLSDNRLQLKGISDEKGSPAPIALPMLQNLGLRDLPAELFGQAGQPLSNVQLVRGCGTQPAELPT
jgi:hypothetical protein